jgi:2-iminobutanoate/2-iminopropanoate deaminase
MQRRAINAEDAPPAIGYARAIEVTAVARTLYVSGQIPVDANGQCPEGFAAQCRLTWRNVMAQLAAADIEFD